MKRKRPHRLLELVLFDRNLTPATVAKAAKAKGHKLSMPTVYGLINGTSPGSRRTRYALAAALDVTVEAVDRMLGEKKK